MKKRYYLSMLSVFPLIMFFDTIYFIFHRSMEIYLLLGLVHFIIFGLLVFLGSYYIYKPINQLLSQGTHLQVAKERIRRLTKYSTGCVLGLGVFFVIVSTLPLFLDPTIYSDIEVFDIEKMPTVYLLSNVPVQFYVNALLPAFIIYFLINDFSFDLKTKVYAQFQILYPAGKRKIGHTLLTVFILLVLVPVLLVILELWMALELAENYEQFSSLNPLETIMIDRFTVLAGMLIAIVFVTRSFTRPISSLLKVIDKVSEGDYTIQAAIIADDEIGLLTKKFNDMVQELETSRIKQEEYSHTLEKNVEQLNREIIEREKAEELARQQQEKLFQSEKMASVGILVSGVAHEINNPNNFILLNSDNLSDIWTDLRPFLDRYAKDYGDFVVAGLQYSEIRDEVALIINGIKEGSERITKIVKTLKDFARKDPGNLDQVVDIANVIDDSVTILASLIKKSTDRFTINLSEDLPKIKGNIQQIEQVVINLISNACQALGDRSQGITVSTVLQDPCISIVIQDEGGGIASEDLKYIMDPFFTTKRDTGGTGLGLSISYNIVKDHGGDLTIQSQVGRGTTATITLPL